MKPTVWTMKIIVSCNGDNWRLVQGVRTLGSYSSMAEAMAAVKLFSHHAEVIGNHCELIVEDEPQPGDAHPISLAD